MMNLTDTLDRIALDASHHLRITHCVEQGATMRAQSLLELRMTDIINDRLIEDDDKGELNPLIDSLRHLNGPMLHRELRFAASRRISRML